MSGSFRALVPKFPEAGHVEVELNSTAHMSNEELGARVPPVSDWTRTAVLVMSVPDSPPQYSQLSQKTANCDDTPAMVQA